MSTDGPTSGKKSQQGRELDFIAGCSPPGQMLKVAPSGTWKCWKDNRVACSRQQHREVSLLRNYNLVLSQSGLDGDTVCLHSQALMWQWQLWEQGLLPGIRRQDGTTLTEIKSTPSAHCPPVLQKSPWPREGDSMHWGRGHVEERFERDSGKGTGCSEHKL